MTRNPPPLGRLLPIADVADRLACSDEHVYGLIQRGLLKGINIGKGTQRGAWRVEEGELARYMKVGSR